jgi:hypothetical protein
MKILGKLKSYWKEILVLAIATGYFAIMTAPDMSWVNCASDADSYLRAGKFIELSHPTGAPLFNMFNWMVLQIYPFSNEFWVLSMVSAVCSGITAMLVYVLAKRYTQNGWKRLIAPLVYCASGMVVSQATIIETYAPMTLLWTLAYWFHDREQHRAKYITIMIGMGIHHLILIPLGVFFIADMIRLKRSGKALPVEPKMLLPLLGLLFYIYVPLANSEPYVWISGNAPSDYGKYFFNQGGLVGGLAIFESDAIQRLQDFVMVIGISFAASGLLILPAMWRAIKKGSRDVEGKLLVFLVVFVMIYYLTDMAPQIYRYMVVAFPFAGLLAVKGSEAMGKKWANWGVVGLVLISSVVLMGYNIQNYDIGRNLDKESIARQYYNTMDEIPSNACLWSEAGGWWQGTTWLYSSETGREITILPQFGHRDRQENIDQAIREINNGNLWMQDYTGNMSWESNVRLATMDDLPRIIETADKVYEYEAGGAKTGWSNPTALIQGKLEMSRWHFVTKSSQNASFVIFLFMAGIFSATVSEKLFKGRCKSKMKYAMLTAMMFVVVMAIVIGILAMGGMTLR